ncbi:MAG: aminopeptidase P family protein [Chloroflexi bacterium]|nr:aminopeptidase P family protein [Chloroflexota bacterium]
MTISLTQSPFDTNRIDFERMRRDRHAKLLKAMQAADIDALILSGRANVMYATGAQPLLTDSARDFYQPTMAAVTRDGATHLFTPYPEGAAPGFSRDNVHAPFMPEFEDGVRQMADRLKALIGPALKGKVGVDDFSAAMMTLLPELLPRATFVDPGPAIGGARLCKTRDEIECLKTAQAINDNAMYDVYQRLRPGVRQTELTGIFLKRILELGATGNHVDPIWMVPPARLSDGPRMLLQDLAFPLPTTGRILDEGDTILVDTGIEYMGYASDFGRTWLCSLDPRPPKRQVEAYKVWREVSLAVQAAARPGKTGGDVTRAALKASGGRKAWLKQFYIVHGIGLDSAEAPMIGTSLGDQFDESIVLQPGMIMVIEPVIWEDGYGGYRSEDIIAVGEKQPEMISTFPYTPWEPYP